MLAWPSLADAAAGAAERGDRAETSARAARVFEWLARDVTRNLRGFGAEEDARDGVPPRLGSPYAAPGGADEWGARGFAWDLPPGAADAMVSALCDHFEAEDAPAAERVLRECGMHEALAAAMLRLAVSCETAARRNAAPPPRWDVERAVAAVIRAYGSLLASGPPESRADPFDEDPNESEATVDGAATVVIDQTDTETARARTRLARDAVERGVLAAALLAADAGAFRSVHGDVRAYDGFQTRSLGSSEDPPPTTRVRGDDEDHEETLDGLLENFVGVLLTALDDPACGDAGRSILLAGAAAESARLDAYTVPSPFRLSLSGANASPATPRVESALLTCVFAHVKYGDRVTELGDTKTVAAEANGRLLARFAPALAASLASARDVPTRAADDACLFAFAAGSATADGSFFPPGDARNNVEDALGTVAWLVARRAEEEKNCQNCPQGPSGFAASGRTAGAFSSFSAFLRSGTRDGARAADRLARAVVYADDNSSSRVFRETKDDRREAVASLLLKDLAHPRAQRRWFEVGDGDDDTAEGPGDPPRLVDPRRFVEGLGQSAAAVVLLASRACVRLGRDTNTTEPEVAFSVSPWGTTRVHWVGCDEANAAMDASLFVLSRRPATPATLAAARQLWPLLGESGPIDTTFVDRMTIASMCALVELDERDVPSTAAGPDPVRPMCEGLASFAALQGLTRFSPSRIRSSPSSASERVSAASYDAFGAAATMRALAAVVAGELRTVTEAANRPDDDACASSAWLLVADAARAALRDWHREAVAPSAPGTNAFGDDERDQKSPSSDARAHYRRLVREARRAAIDLVRVTAAASLPRGDHTADGHAVVAILSDVAEDESEDGVAALDALAAWALAETPAGVSKRGDLPPSVVRLVVQSGRAAMCSRSEAARDAGAACLWAVLRVGEPGETNALLSDDDEEDGTDRAVDDPDDYEITFEDGSGNWEASLFEDWLSDVDPAVSNAVPKRARGSETSPSVPSVEGRLRLAATLARVAPGAFESKVARSPEAARRLFSHALSSGAAPHFSRFLSPGALATLRSLVDAGATRRLDAAEAKRDERGFRLLKGSMFSSRVRGDRFVSEPEPAFSEARRESEGKGRGFFGFGALATATPRWFPRRGADALAALDALVADLDEEMRAEKRARA